MLINFDCTRLVQSNPENHLRNIIFVIESIILFDYGPDALTFYAKAILTSD